MFLGNILLPLIWMALTGTFSLGNFAVGFAISSLSLWTISAPGEVTFLLYIVKFIRIIHFLLFFVWELLLANLRVAYEVLTPEERMLPAIIAIPLDIKSDLEITILANLITLTPGTLTLDVSPERDMLYIHAMYVKNVDKFRREIKERFERRVMEIFQ
jgi:multicomponent Na+:H+ antiporter subunit E